MFAAPTATRAYHFLAIHAKRRRVSVPQLQCKLVLPANRDIKRGIETAHPVTARPETVDGWVVLLRHWQVDLGKTETTHH